MATARGRRQVSQSPAGRAGLIGHDQGIDSTAGQRHQDGDRPTPIGDGDDVTRRGLSHDGRRVLLERSDPNLSHVLHRSTWVFGHQTPMYPYDKFRNMNSPTTAAMTMATTAAIHSGTPMDVAR